MQGTIADIHCLKCGAPAGYDIIRHSYHCAYCGGNVGIHEAHIEKQGFRAMQQEKIRNSAEHFHLMHANCTGCGAQLIFDKGEAMANCSFCGRKLIRSEYLRDAEIPEMIIPFRITKEEAVELLGEWCRQNKSKPEAAALQKKLGALSGFYLPYEFIRGPVSCQVSRMDSSRIYNCEGYVDEVFVNCSGQLDNLLLDGMEPYELDELQAFDFALTAGQRIRIRDISDGKLLERIGDEVSKNYSPAVREVLETNAVNIRTHPSEVLRMPVLLPAYYIRADKVIAAVNGQTGKVSVRAEKESRYIFLPWWLKAILATLIIGGVSFGIFYLSGLDAKKSGMFSLYLSFITLIVSLCIFSESTRNQFFTNAGHKIFTSAGGPVRRDGNKLVRDPKELPREIVPPVFFESIGGQKFPVQLKFSVRQRQLKAALLGAAVIMFPVLIALLLNGFDFERLNLGGSAVWFCIAAPVVPIYFLEFFVIRLYERPIIYKITEQGKQKLKRPVPSKEEWLRWARMILKMLFVPPLCFGIWFAILMFCVICYLTAFGFE